MFTQLKKQLSIGLPFFVPPNRFFGLRTRVKPVNRPSHKMNRPDYWQPAIFSDRVTVNGTVRTLSLLSDGRLWWPEGGQRSLTVEKEVIGFVADGPNIKLKTVVESRDGCCAGGSRGILVRNDVVFRPLSEESHRLWCQKLRQFINSLGN